MKTDSFFGEEGGKYKKTKSGPEHFSQKVGQNNTYQESPRQTKPKKGQFMNFPGGKFIVNRACFPKEKTPEYSQKMGEIHELFVFALSLV